MFCTGIIESLVIGAIAICYLIWWASQKDNEE